MENKKSGTAKKIFSVAAVLWIAVIIEALFVLGTVQVGITKADVPLVVAIHAAAILAAVMAYLRVFRNFKPPLAVRWIVNVILPFAAFLVLEYLTHDPFEIKWQIILLNLAVFYLVAAFFAVLTRRTSVGIWVTTLVLLTGGVVSYYTTQFRSAPLFPWDIASAGTAVTVISNYRIEFAMKVVFTIAIGLLIIEAGMFANVKLKLGRWYVRVAATLVALCALVGSVVYLQTDDAISRFGLYPYLFTPNVLYKRNGFTVSFLMNLRYTTVEKPSGYSSAKTEQIAGEYESDKAEGNDLPNVIVIMNESLAEMKYLCDYETNEPYFPFIDSLKENTAKGKLHMSVIGGNTPNSEFEFLTGLTMAYLPQGSIPYQQFLKEDSPSLATQFDGLGYRTVAMHPYYASGWKRNEIYPRFGFEESYFLDTAGDPYFKRSRKIRGYVSDEALYDRIIEIFEESDEPLFTFAVTMQNHGGYWDEFENFTPEITVNGLENSFVVSQYMSLVRESDRAFEKLVEYFEGVDEKTVIVMFGDHQPGDAVANPLLKNAGQTLDANSVADMEKRYIAPYIVWTNYDCDLDMAEDMTPAYLSAAVLRSAGIPQTGEQKFLLDLAGEFPTVNARAFTDKDGTLKPINEYPRCEGLLEYAQMQYAYLFDRKNAPMDFWNLK
ncbi:MAG: sulfatase-like hydrolase/transferase [Clostridia bacterium]|nr:sulfatase-like hydrolase/transferase [Clostridia bacterium]